MGAFPLLLEWLLPPCNTGRREFGLLFTRCRRLFVANTWQPCQATVKLSHARKRWLANPSCGHRDLSKDATTCQSLDHPVRPPGRWRVNSRTRKQPITSRWQKAVPDYIHARTHRCVETGWAVGLYWRPQLVVTKWSVIPGKSIDSIEQFNDNPSSNTNKQSHSYCTCT